MLIVTIMTGDVVVRLHHFLILTGDVVVPHIRDPMVGKRTLDVQMENIKRSGRMEEKKYQRSGRMGKENIISGRMGNAQNATNFVWFSTSYHHSFSYYDHQ
jgi:hypothetical protein